MPETDQKIGPKIGTKTGPKTGQRTVGCPTETTLDLIAGRWKVLAIYWLLQGDRRFNQLQRDLAGITPRTLTRQLREMQADGLVARRDMTAKAPHVEYGLTARGRSLEPVLLAMDAWARKNDGRTTA